MIGYDHKKMGTFQIAPPLTQTMDSGKQLLLTNTIALFCVIKVCDSCIMPVNPGVKLRLTNASMHPLQLRKEDLDQTTPTLARGLNTT